MYREGYSCTHPQQSHKTTLAGILRQDSFVRDNPLGVQFTSSGPEVIVGDTSVGIALKTRDRRGIARIEAETSLQMKFGHKTESVF